jgi:hypothetical protein
MILGEGTAKFFYKKIKKNKKNKMASFFVVFSFSWKKERKKQDRQEFSNIMASRCRMQTSRNLLGFLLKWWNDKTKFATKKEEAAFRRFFPLPEYSDYACLTEFLWQPPRKGW